MSRQNKSYREIQEILINNLINLLYLINDFQNCISNYMKQFLIIKFKLLTYYTILVLLSFEKFTNKIRKYAKILKRTQLKNRTYTILCLK
jgi:hypothetical protein